MSAPGTPQLAPLRHNGAAKFDFLVSDSLSGTSLSQRPRYARAAQLAGAGGAPTGLSPETASAGFAEWAGGEVL